MRNKTSMLENKNVLYVGKNRILKVMRKFIFKKPFWIIFSLYGCMVGPDYKEPEVVMPDHYIENGQSLVVSSLKDWWKTFNDPVLDSMVERSITNNYDLKIAIEKIEETRAYYRIKRANLFPEIDMTATAIRYGLSQNIIQNSLLPLNAYNLFAAGFDASWEIDVFGKLRREKEAAYYEMQAMQENMRDVYIKLISDVARYYVDLCAIQNIIEMTNKKIELQNIVLSLIKDRKEKGLNSKISEDEELSRLKVEEENLLYYNTLFKQTAYLLSTLLGIQPESFSENYGEFKKVPIATEKVPMNLPSSLLRQRPDIRSAERQLAQATAIVGAAIGEFFPIFSLTGNTSFEVNKIRDFFMSRSFSWSLGSVMQWPIINFGRIRANVDVKKSQQKQALLKYENTILSALKDVESALIAYYNEDEKLKDISVEVLSFKDISVLEKSKYQTGINSLFNYIEAEKGLIDKEIKKVESERYLAHDLIALYKALGGDDWSDNTEKK